MGIVLGSYVHGKDPVSFLRRFKTEVAKALESFVEKEDEFIKQVMLQVNMNRHPEYVFLSETFW